MGGATRLGREKGVADREKIRRRRSSDAFVVYVRANMEDPVWVPDVWQHKAGEFERQLGKGIRWGRIK